MKQIELGFRKGFKPKLTDDGTSGTYILRGPGKQNLAVFKPIDEEAFAPNNPRNNIGPFGSQSFRKGVLSGEACVREVAAFLLDRDGFLGVPDTTLLSFQDDSLRQWRFSDLKIKDEQKKDFLTQVKQLVLPEVGSKPRRSLSKDKFHFLKIGSLQSFVNTEGPIENFSEDLFTPEQVHRIAILDLRILNLDRNHTNILVTKACP
jgi:hypothetical protein